MTKRKKKNWERGLDTSSNKSRFKRVPIVSKWTQHPGEASTALDARGYLRYKNHKLVHRTVYEAAHGAIPETWVVHHIDFDKTFNRLENLIALPEAFHHTIHSRMAGENTKWGRAKITRELVEHMAQLDHYDDLLSERNALYDANSALLDRYTELQSKLGTMLFLKPQLECGLAHLEILKKLIESSNPEHPPTLSPPSAIYLKKVKDDGPRGRTHTLILKTGEGQDGAIGFVDKCEAKGYTRLKKEYKAQEKKELQRLVRSSERDLARHTRDLSTRTKHY